MVRKYFSRITLFTLLACVCFTALLIVLISHETAEVKSWLLFRLFIGTILLIIIDVLVKRILNLKTAWVWALQIFLLLAAVYAWIISD